MTLLHAFLDQVIMAFIALIVCYPQRDQLPENFRKSGIYYFAFFIFTVGTWFRWYYQLPLMGFFKYLF